MLITLMCAVGCMIAGCYGLCDYRNRSCVPYLLMLAGMLAMIAIPLVDTVRHIIG